MKKKRLLSCVLIVALLLSLCAIGVGAATVDDFTDVSPDDWYYDAVSEVAAAGYFNGTSATTFDPQLTMTRAMFVTVLARFDGATVDNSADTTFADVPTGQYYTGAVAWAAENGLVQGYGGNAFDTFNPITRQDMAVLMTRYIAYYEAKNSIAATTSATGTETTHNVVDDPADFADAASIAAYAAEAVVECANYGLLVGDENGNFRPTASATRAEAAAVISRLDWTRAEIAKLDEKVTGGGGGSSSTYYYLKLDPNGGTLTLDSTPYTEAQTVSQKNNSSFTLSSYTVTLDGYTLAGWNKSADGTGTAYATTGTFTSSVTSSNNANLVTLYAQWTEDTVEIDTDDKIGLSVLTAIGEFDTRVYETEQYFTTTKIDGTNYTYAQTGDLAVTPDMSTWSVGTEDAGMTREVTVAIDAAVDADSLETIARVAASMARDMVSGTAVSSLTAADLRSVVTEVVKQLEDATGLNLSLDVNNIVESLRGEGSTFWQDTGIGEYVSGMTVTIDGSMVPAATLVFTVDDNGAVAFDRETSGYETLTVAATACAKAAASQLLDSLVDSLGETTLSEEIDNFALSAGVNIAFTPNDEYAETVAPYATDYTLNVTTSFDSNDTILFAFDGKVSGGHIDVALNMTNTDIATKYVNGYARALNSAAVQNRIASMVESMITSGSSEEGSGNILSAINDILVEATSGSSSEESSAVSSAVTDAVTKWVVTNATNGSTEMDNSAIYSLVDTLAETTIDSETVDSEYISNALTSSGVSEEDAAVVTAYVDAYQDAYTAATESGTTLTEDDIAEIKASVAEDYGDVDAVLDALIEAYLNGEITVATSVMADSDSVSWTAMLDAAADESGTVTMNDILTLLSDLGTVEGLQNCTVESLGNLLQSGLLDNYSGMVSTALNSISNINITTPESLEYAITIKSAKDTNNTVELNSAMLTRITDSENGIKELGTILTDNFVGGETVADLYLEVYVNYAPVSMYIDFSLYFGE